MIDRDPFRHDDEDYLPLDPTPIDDDLGPAEQPEGPDATPPGVSADFVQIAASIYASPAIGAFLSRRVDRAIRHGHTPASDLDRPAVDLGRHARDRVRDAVEMIAGREPSREALAQSLLKIDIAGGLLLALRDRIAAALDRTESSSNGG